MQNSDLAIAILFQRHSFGPSESLNPSYIPAVTDTKAGRRFIIPHALRIRDIPIRARLPEWRGFGLRRQAKASWIRSSRLQAGQPLSARQILRARARENPPFRQAVMADARAVARTLNEMSPEGGPLRSVWLVLCMIWQADGFLALLLCRLASRLQAWGVPFIPKLLRRISMIIAQVHIGAPVVLEPGIILPHGQVVIDGITHIGEGAIIRPFVTIGLTEGNYLGPTLGPHVKVGTGAKVLGPVTVGKNARIGANAVVLRDVPAGATAIGVPARAK